MKGSLLHEKSDARLFEGRDAPGRQLLRTGSLLADQHAHHDRLTLDDAFGLDSRHHPDADDFFDSDFFGHAYLFSDPHFLGNSDFFGQPDRFADGHRDAFVFGESNCRSDV